MPYYRNKHKLNHGYFGDVYLCERDTDGERFAKKTLKDGLGADAEERFTREVRMLSKLDHPNIVSVVAKRLHAKPFWYAMPLYRHSLSDELAHIIGDDDRIHDIFTSILDGMEYAHGQGVIHRDLKPNNVLLNSDDDLVIADFGLGRAVDAKSTRKTGSGYMLGTVPYMPPEQFVDAKSADERSDIFSLGRMLFELYTAKLKSPAQDMTGVPPEIAVVVERCTKPNPDDRFQTVADLKNAWLTAIGAAGSVSIYDALNDAIARIEADIIPSTDDIDIVLELLYGHQDDTDLVHESLMKLGAEAFRIMVIRNLPWTRTLIKVFVDHVTSQSWPFSYTDRIATVCVQMYKNIEDVEIRANVVYCLLEVGVSHNRWFVMSKFEDVMYADKMPAEPNAIAERLSNARRNLREWALEHLSSSRIDSIVASALRDGPTRKKKTSKKKVATKGVKKGTTKKRPSKKKTKKKKK